MMGLEQRKRTQSRARQNRRNQPRCLFWWVPMSRLGVDSAELPMRSGHVKRRSDATTKTNPGSRPIKTTPSLLGNILCFELNQLRTQHLKTNFLQPRACPSSSSFSISNRIERQLLHLRFPPNRAWAVSSAQQPGYFARQFSGHVIAEESDMDGISHVLLICRMEVARRCPPKTEEKGTTRTSRTTPGTSE